MSLVFQELNDDRLNYSLTETIYPRLSGILQSRGLGHCMRVIDLELEMMTALCRAFRRDMPEAQVFILADRPLAGAEDLQISSTKLVELRNPLPDGSQRPPLMAFIPPNLRTSAEDSFGIATFEEISNADTYKELVRTLLERIPVSLRGHTQDILNHLKGESWGWAEGVSQARFLLTALENGVDGETLGASLFELGLIPDFRLFEDPTTTFGRIRKNCECARELTYSSKSVRGRALDLGLSDKAVQRRLIQLLDTVGVEDPRVWTRLIVIDKSLWPLSFDKWQFEEEISPDRVAITVEGTDLPTVAETESDARLQDLINQQVLIPSERKKFNAIFRVEPHPGQVQGLSTFSVQIVSRDGGPVGKVKNVKVWKPKRDTCTVALDKLNKVDFEEGWHFVRVLPWTENGDPIPMVEPAGGFSGEAARPNESEPFYVLPEGIIEDPPLQRAIPQEFSLEHARLKLQFTAIQDQRDPAAIKSETVGWAEGAKGGRRGAQEMIIAKFGRDGAFHIPVARPLKQLEQRILSSPGKPVSWRLQINRGTVEEPTGEVHEWSKSAAVDSFLSARERYFEAIRKGNKELVSQGADFLEIKELCAEYAAAYRDLLLDLRRKIERSAGADQQRAILALRTALSVDTVRVVNTDFRGRAKEAALLGPTHPLRALWLATWAQVSQQWAAAAKGGPEEYVGLVRDAVLRGLVPQNVPFVQALSDGRLFTAVDNLHPFWSLYAPATEEDSRGLLGEICSAMGLPEPAIGGNSISGEVLASRVERYLTQHPYIRTLTVNAFNPGRASVLAEAFVALQKQQAFEHLRYDLRLFVPDPEAPHVGEEILQLLSPEGTTTTEAVDAFSASTGSHLFPKLNWAVHLIDDFYKQPDSYRAHLSILFDLFPAEDVGAGPAFRAMDAAPLHGLIQDYATDFHDDEDGTFWRKQPRHGVAQALAGCDNLVGLLADLPQVMSGATATVAVAAPAFEHRPVLTLGLDATQRELIYYVHEASDWVFTIDRNIGIEFFDHGGRRERPDYLIDYVPGVTMQCGHQLVITSRSLLELESMLQPVLEQYGLKAEGRHGAMLLEQLRSLSGRLALKLISSPMQQAEAVGLALARLFLKYQGALSNQIVVPLDTHLDLFHTVKRQVDEIGDAISLQRTDLALFDLNASTRTICCSLVEVKCYTQVGGLGAYNQLKEAITQQINQSERVLQRHFDPNWKTPDRPDRLLKTRQFVNILEFYLERAIRYGLMDPDAAEEARILLTALEDGYSLEFRRSALIFDFEKPGTGPPDHEVGIEFHRIGVDLIKALVEGIRSRTTEGVAEEEELVEIPAIPRLEQAAFLVPERERSVTWESLALRGDETLPTEGAGVEAPSPAGFDAEEQKGDKDEVKAGSQGEREAEQVPQESPVQAEPSSQLNGAKAGEPIAPGVSDAGKHHGRDVQGEPAVSYDVILGAQSTSPQYGVIGEAVGRKVALDLNQTHTISLFGVQGGGKSYTLGTIVEMACVSIPNINMLPSPLATVIFHYSPTQDYKPEFTSMVSPNEETDQLSLLKERYGAEPVGLKDVLILTSASKLQERQAEYPHIEILPITFAASELKAMHWKFLMGAVGSQSMYLRQVNLVMRKLRERLTLDDLLHGVEDSSLSDHLKDLARTRIRFAAEYIDDNRHLTDVIRPGRLIIVDLRDEFIEKDEALGLFVVLLQIFSEARFEGRSFNKLVVFDEAHKYIENPDLIAGLIEVVREMRHKGTSIMVASQDPPSVPVSIIELSSQIILHKFNSPAWLKHIQKANAALNLLTPEKMSQLGPGEAYVWSSKASDDGFTSGAMKIRCRPRVTRHGGSTKTAVGG